MSAAIQVYNEMSGKDIETLVQGGIIPKDTPPAQVALFSETCRRQKLDPFKKQIYLVGYGGKYSTIVGIDGMRAKASRTGLFAGCDDAKFDLQPNGNFETAEQLARINKKPTTCTITVYKAIGGMRCPFTKTVVFNEYCPSSPSGKWGSMPFNMIAKCAEAAALRMAFAEETAGLNIEEEVHAMQDVTIQAVQTKQKEKYDRQKAYDTCIDTLAALNLTPEQHEWLRLEIEDADDREKMGVVYRKLLALQQQQEPNDPKKQFEMRVKN